MFGEFSWPLLTLLALGAFHGVNPAMGWLFAVALGMQHRQRGAVLRALGPLAVGHALAVGVTVALAAAIGLVIPLSTLKWFVAGALVLLGGWQLVRHRHPRWGGMLINAKDLTVWSFLMASAHGAGLMVLPFLMGGTAGPASAATEGHHHHAVAADPLVSLDHAHHADHLGMLAGMASEPIAGLIGTAVHALGYLVVMGLVSVIVYEKLGLRLLQKTWVNLDIIWSVTLIVTGLLTLVL
jgi:hypothetical protein